MEVTVSSGQPSNYPAVMMVADVVVAVVVVAGVLGARVAGARVVVVPDTTADGTSSR
jgi:hypothetical protein